MRIINAAFFILLFITLHDVSAQSDNPEKASVLATAQKLFDCMAAQDTTLARTILLKEGQFYAIRNKSDGLVLRAVTYGQFIKGLVNKERRILERMWDPTVLIHDQVAVVWAPYDLHINNKFSHCGVDAFTLLKTNEGWKISHIAYTVEPEGCKESPLGPVNGK